MNRPRSLAPLQLMAAALLLAVGLGASGLRYNSTPSLPRGLYREAPGELVRGSLVSLCLPIGVATFGRERGYLPPGSCPANAAPVLKVVGAVAGDHVELTEDGVFVNGELLQPPAPRLDQQGRLLVPLEPRVFELAAGELWLYAPHERSWDSRYFGPVSRPRDLRVVQPVWISSGVSP